MTRTLLFVLSCLLLTACNTMQGIGKDIESLGSGLDRTARDTQEKL